MSELHAYFSAIAAKYLTAVDAEPNSSNQHEFGGLTKPGFAAHLGDPGESGSQFTATFIYFDDASERPFMSESTATWYDCRRDKPNRSAEYRLYYQANEVTDKFGVGDLMIIGLRPDRSLVLFFAPANSVIANTLCYLFNISLESDKSFVARAYQARNEVDIVRSSILQTLDIAPAEQELPLEYEDIVSAHFGLEFPKTAEFSRFARETLQKIDLVSNPDVTVLSWMEREEALFFALERLIVEQKLTDGFEDVDDFIKFSLSVQNRRKSRAGHAFEHHLDAIFEGFGLLRSRGKITENKSRPDFLFPGIEHYQNAAFDEKKLTMLGVKTSCKDRWRQVLVEAERINDKHLITLEPGISENQTDEMQNHKLQLVVPRPLQVTYSGSQRNWLLDLAEFIELIARRQDA